MLRRLEGFTASIWSAPRLVTDELLSGTLWPIPRRSALASRAVWAWAGYGVDTGRRKQRSRGLLLRLRGSPRVRRFLPSRQGREGRPPSGAAGRRSAQESRTLGPNPTMTAARTNAAAATMATECRIYRIGPVSPHRTSIGSLATPSGTIAVRPRSVERATPTVSSHRRIERTNWRHNRRGRREGGG